MAKLIHVKRAQVRRASAAFEKLLAKDPEARREKTEREREEKAEKARRDAAYKASQPKTAARRRARR